MNKKIKKYDKAKVEKAVKMMLEGFGEDLNNSRKSCRVL